MTTLELHPVDPNPAHLQHAVTTWLHEHPLVDFRPATAPPDHSHRDLAMEMPGSRPQQQADHLRAERMETLRQRSGFWWFLKKHFVGTTWAERNWQVGAEGEKAVGNLLRMLDPAWAVLHSIEVGHRGADIDHLVIGPPGAFTINTKTHPGGSIFVAGNTFMVNGYRHPYIESSRFEAKRAANLLSRAVGFRVPVTPLIVPVGFRRLVVREAPKGVFVIAAPHLVPWFTTYPMIFPAHITALIYEKARVSTTWLT